MTSIHPQKDAALPFAGPQKMIVGVHDAQREIAFRRRLPGQGAPRPGVVWLPGFKSDMASTKASALDSWAAAQGRALLRFDYSGHGESGGAFEDGCIGHWLEDALALIRSQSAGPQIIVGSSMGGWIALLAARALHAAGDGDRLAGMVLIAPAVDFTQALIWERLPPHIQREVVEKGRWLRPNQYGADAYPITLRLIEEGRAHGLLGKPIRSHCPVHILQGMQDPDVPWAHAMTLVEHLAADPVTITLIKDGEHRLSRPQDMALLLAAIEGIA